MEHIHKVHKLELKKRKLAKPSLSSLGHFSESQLPLNTQRAIKKNKQRTSRYKANADVSRVYAISEKTKENPAKLSLFPLGTIYGVHV